MDNDNYDNTAIEEQARNDIVELQKMETAVVERPYEETPIGRVEESLASFTQHAFAIVNEDFEFSRAVRGKILEKLDNFNETQLLALDSNQMVNLNDRISKLLAPTFNLLSAKQQAEIARLNAQKNNTNNTILMDNDIKQLNTTASKDILQGLAILNSMLGKLPQTTEQED
jgi:hypothetical protein